MTSLTLNRDCTVSAGHRLAVEGYLAHRAAQTRGRSHQRRRRFGSGRGALDSKVAEVLRIQYFERNPQPFFQHFIPCRTQVSGSCSLVSKVTNRVLLSTLQLMHLPKSLHFGSYKDSSTRAWLGGLMRPLADYTTGEETATFNPPTAGRADATPQRKIFGVSRF